MMMFVHVTFIEKKPTLTLDEMRAKLHETLSMGIAQKSRKEFVEWLLNEFSSKTLISLEECGFNNWTGPTHGRAFKG